MLLPLCSVNSACTILSTCIYCLYGFVFKLLAFLSAWQFIVCPQFEIVWFPIKLCLYELRPTKGKDGKACWEDILAGSQWVWRGVRHASWCYTWAAGLLGVVPFHFFQPLPATLDMAMSLWSKLIHPWHYLEKEIPTAAVWSRLWQCWFTWLFLLGYSNHLSYYFSQATSCFQYSTTPILSACRPLGFLRVFCLYIPFLICEHICTWFLL